MCLPIRAVFFFITLLFVVGNAQYQSETPSTAPLTQPTTSPYGQQQPTSAPLTQPTPYAQPIVAPYTQPIPFPQALQAHVPLQCPLFQFQHSVIPVSPGSNEYKITFTVQMTTVNLVFVDVHWLIVHAGGSQEFEMNERMTKLGANSFERLLGSFPIRLGAGDCIHYSFTYCALANSLRIDCDTDKFSSCPQAQPLSSTIRQQQLSSSFPAAPILSQPTYGAPAQAAFVPAPLTATTQQFQCPLFQVQHAVAPIAGTDQWKIQFNALTTMDVALVDVHWQIKHGGGELTEMINERMTKLSANSFERAASTVPLRLNSGDCVQYWFTYCVGTQIGRVDCDTERFSSCAIQQQQPLLQASYQPQPLSQFQPSQRSY